MNDLKAVQKQLWETESERFGVVDRFFSENGIPNSLAHVKLLDVVR